MKQPRTYNSDLVHKAAAILGEGPVWDHRKGLLYWVDIEAGMLHVHEPKQGLNRQWTLGEMIGAVLPARDGKLVLAMESGLHLFDPESEASVLLALENRDPSMRFNDGKCDPQGNLWIGSMHKEHHEGKGSLYRIDPELQLTVQIPATTISNGMAWTADRKTFFFSDTATYTVWAFDMDPDFKKISNRKVLFEIPFAYGGADGMTLDQEGKLWIAHWGGSCVRRWDPETGRVMEVVRVAAPQVTSCCFGGEKLETLYITTARSGLNPGQLTDSPLSGGLFQCHPGVSGLPITYFNHPPHVS